MISNDTTRKKKHPGRSAIIIVAAILVVYTIVTIIAVRQLYSSNFRRINKPEYTTNLAFEEIGELTRSAVEFKSGENTLRGYVYGSDNDQGLVVIAHGFGGSLEGMIMESAYFTERGWRVFAYDATGSYSSDGESRISLAQSALDLDAALTYIESDMELSTLPVMLFGHSWGGYAVTAALNYDHNVSAAVSVSGYDLPMEMFAEEAYVKVGALNFFLYPSEWIYNRAVMGEVFNLSAVNGINKSGVPVMIIHGAQDKRVKYNGASIISHADRVTNLNVVYRTVEGRGHGDILLSEDALSAVDVMNAESARIYGEYGNSIPKEVKDKFYDDIDRRTINELDEGLMGEINAFFETALKSR